jgi:hypothetical protein
MEGSDLQAWVEEEFASLDLGHAARERCARDVLRMMARGVGTRVTDFTESAAQRQQAYGFMENTSVGPQALTTAAAQGALKRLDADAEWCIVPVDGSSLKLADEFGKKGFGRIGSHDSTRGLIVQTALGLDERGVPLGILAQVFWTRPQNKAPTGPKAARRGVGDKEVRYWLEVVSTAEASGSAAGLDGRLWFQLDRGYDCAAMLERMATSSNRFTIRGEYDRALWLDASSDDEAAAAAHRSVRQALDASPVLTEMSVHIDRGPNRSERQALLLVQVAEVDVRLTDASRRGTERGDDGKRRRVAKTWPRTLTAVRVREVGTTPDGESPLMWMLWVNTPVTTGAAAKEVVRAYALRWRVEEFHRMWKSGAMKVEQTQARSGDNVERVARMAALVACRILRLTRLARTSPETEAATEFSRPELAVLKFMDPRSPKQSPRPERLGSIAWAIAVIADMGGYTGRSSGGPPGPLVLARGLQRLLDRADGFAAAMAIRDQC